MRISIVKRRGKRKDIKRQGTHKTHQNNTQIGKVNNTICSVREREVVRKE